jgi:hypothetical protein
MIPDTRKMHCSKCQGHIVTPDKPPKRKKERLSFRENERMMQSAYGRFSGQNSISSEFAQEAAVSLEGEATESGKSKE